MLFCTIISPIGNSGSLTSARWPWTRPSGISIHTSFAFCTGRIITMCCTLCNSHEEQQTHPTWWLAGSHCIWTVILLRWASHRTDTSPCQHLLHNRKWWICGNREEGRGGGKEVGGRQDMELFIVQQNVITCFTYPVHPNATYKWYPCKEVHLSLLFMASQGQDPPFHFIFLQAIWTQPLFLEKLTAGPVT